MPTFFQKFFDTSDFPARWNCGNWDSFHGYLHILSDLMIWAAYFMIPVALVYYWWKKREEIEFPKLFWLFGAFIFSCGITHFIDATMFYYPIYRVSGAMKFLTAVVSWMTVFAIIRITPEALSLPGRANLSVELQRQLDKRHDIQERLAESNRELEAYTGRVAHDLRNPLSGVILLGDLALESAQKGQAEVSAEQLSSMLVTLRSMEESIKELHTLSLSRNKEIEMDHVDLEQVVQAVKKGLGEKIEAHDAVVEITQLPTVLGNESLLKHLFTNLIENSLKYRTEANPLITVESRHDSGENVITVCDNGRGIPENEEVRIFDPSYRASNVDQVAGSGIGLSLCKSIMESHKGTIKARPQSKGGLTIEMRFPEISN